MPPVANPPSEDESAVVYDEVIHLEASDIKFASIKKLIEMLTAETHGGTLRSSLLSCSCGGI